MAYRSNILKALADTYFERDADAYARACADAQIRAQVSYFDQHVVRSSHGHYWVADEADYVAEWDSIENRIVFTVCSARSDQI